MDTYSSDLSDADSFRENKPSLCQPLKSGEIWHMVTHIDKSENASPNSVQWIDADAMDCIMNSKISSGASEVAINNEVERRNCTSNRGV